MALTIQLQLGFFRAGTVAALAFATTLASAASCAPMVHVAALHAERGHRSDTPGLGLICEFRNLLAAAGIFSNSNGQASRYVAAGWQPLDAGPARLGVVAGAIDGYAHRGGRQFSFAALTASVPAGPVVLRFMLTPKTSFSSMTLAVAFSF